MANHTDTFVLKTPAMTALERTLKFGLGAAVYIIMVVVIPGFAVGIISGLLPVLAIYMALLFYGKSLVGISKGNRLTE